VRILSKDVPDLDELRMQIMNSRQWNVPLDMAQIEHKLQTWIMKQMRAILESPSSAAQMDLVKDVIELFTRLRFYLDLYEAQNYYYVAQKEIARRSRQLPHDAHASFQRLGETLRFAKEALVLDEK